MARLCLPRPQRDKLAAALKSGELRIRSLYEMDSAQRKTVFTEYVGRSFADTVNAKFEAAMLSRQKDALRRWVERSTTHQEPIRRNLLKRVDRIENILTPDEAHGFMKSMVEERLGIAVSEEEAAQLLSLKQDVDAKLARVEEEHQDYIQSNEFKEVKDIPDEVLEYGMARQAFNKYTQELLNRANALSIEEFRANPFLASLRAGKELLGISRALLSSYDLGLMGRQALPLLLRGNIGQWGKQVVDGFRVFGQELRNDLPYVLSVKQGDDAVMDLIRAQIYSQPHFLSGHYTAAKNGYGLDVIREESFPVDYPERIPIFRSVYKASQSAYSGASLLMRARFASQQINLHEFRGIDMLDEANATALGSLVGSITGRAPLPNWAAPAADTLNKVFFAPRLMQARLNTLTGHMLDPHMNAEIRRTAALSSLRVAMGLTGLLSTIQLFGGEAETDPRHADFGTFKMGNQKIDLTGGMKGYVRLGMRFIPTMHDGKWGFWTQSSTGKWTHAWDDSFGSMDNVDHLVRFFEGRTAPVPSTILQWMRGETYSGERPNIIDTTIGLVAPISGQYVIEELKKGNDELLLGLIAETLGFSASPSTLWLTSDRWQQYKEEKGERAFYQATLEVTKGYNTRADKLKESSQWKRMDNSERSRELDKIRREEQDKVLRRAGIR